MNSPKISVLVPVYKVEAYLQRCIDSVLAQDFMDWEMILVDDGSPDRCPEICDEAAKKDARIRVVHKENGGLPSARLAGFREAKGEYIMFLDSDDYLLSGALSILYTKAREKDFDIIKGADRRFTDDENFEFEGARHEFEIEGSTNYLKALFNHDILPYVWGGLYRRELFTEQTFLTIQDVSIQEDFLANLSIWKSAKKYVYVPTMVYAYYINPKSMMQQKVLSHEYVDFIGRMMQGMTLGCDEDISPIIRYDRIVAHIRAFFMPEIRWNSLIYRQILDVVKNKKDLCEIKKRIDKKFILFITSGSIYRLYTAVYRFLFLHFKLNGEKRAVI